MTTKAGGFSRREVIQRALYVAGWAGIAGSTTIASACAVQERIGNAESGALSVADIAWLDEVAETILPETETPGAKAANVGAFIALMVSDTYSPEAQREFREGMRTLETACVAAHGAGFMSVSDEQRLTLLQSLDAQAHKQQDIAEIPPHYFSRIKGLAVLGYFTSEVGYTQALQYVETPGRFEPCVEYVPGERAWARHA
jgi:hypothetical protein